MIRKFARHTGYGLFLTALLAAAGSTLGAAAQQSPPTFRGLSPMQVAALPADPPDLVEAYGKDKLQFGELRMPKGVGPFPVAVVIHGGCWTEGFAPPGGGMAPAASALTHNGFATWNIEYRELGDAGAGWPGTFQDWAAAADHLRDLAKRYPLDLSRVVTVGHSAGAHAALWLAGRSKLPLASEVRGAKPLPIAAAVAIDGPGDLVATAERGKAACRGLPVVENFMGGTPAQQPKRYAEGDPKHLLPLHVPQYFANAAMMTPELTDPYLATAKGKGDTVHTLALKDSGHFDVIAPGTPQWTEVEAFVLQALSDVSPKTRTQAGN